LQKNSTGAKTDPNNQFLWGRFGFDRMFRLELAACPSAVLGYQRATKLNANNVIEADFNRAYAQAA